VPHSPQKRPPPSGAPQEGQVRIVIEAPQARQNFSPAGISAAQLAHPTNMSLAFTVRRDAVTGAGSLVVWVRH
jgi:hypothetical protein